MRCKQCEYTLWTLRDRECPECGTPFQPSQYEFEPGSVRFVCPHCNHDYYGTGPKGHLEPRAFDCVNCGHSLHMDDMVLTPAAGFENNDIYPDDLPWRHRWRIGVPQAWLRMLQLSMFSPTRMMRMVRPSNDIGWGFAAQNAVYASLAAIGSQALAEPLRNRGVGNLGLEQWSLIGAPLLGALLMVWLLLSWATAHIILVLTGRRRGGPERTAQTLCYSAGTLFLASGMFIHFMAGVIALIWWWASSTIALSEAHQVSTARAVTALSAMPVALISIILYVT